MFYIYIYLIIDIRFLSFTIMFIYDFFIDCEKNGEDDVSGYGNNACRSDQMDSYLGTSRNTSQDYSKSK